MLRLLTTFIFIAISTFSKAQTPEESVTAEKIKTITGNTKAYFPDLYGNLLFITDKNVLSKYDVSKDTIYETPLSKNFTVDYIDTNNPLNILVFSKDCNNVITFDKTLVETSRFAMDQLDGIETHLAALSSDDKIWVFDATTNVLLKVDHQLKILFKSAPLEKILGYTLTPKSMFEKDGKVFIYDEMKGMHLFDNFGQPTSSIGIQGLKAITVNDYRLIYILEDMVYAYELPTDQIKVVMPLTTLGLEGYESIQFSKGTIFVQFDDHIDIYSIE